MPRADAATQTQRVWPVFDGVAEILAQARNVSFCCVSGLVTSWQLQGEGSRFSAQSGSFLNRRLFVVQLGPCAHTQGADQKLNAVAGTGPLDGTETSGDWEQVRWEMLSFLRMNAGNFSLL